MYDSLAKPAISFEQAEMEKAALPAEAHRQTGKSDILSLGLQGSFNSGIEFFRHGPL